MKMSKQPLGAWCCILLHATMTAARSGVISGASPLGKQDAKTPVRGISINSRLVPRNVLEEATRRSGILSEQPAADATSRLTAYLNTWYKQNGYIFARVASRSPVRDGKLQIFVVEPVVARTPVSIRYYAAAATDEAMADATPTPSPPPVPGVRGFLRRTGAR